MPKSRRSGLRCPSTRREGHQAGLPAGGQRALATLTSPQRTPLQLATLALQTSSRNTEDPRASSTRKASRSRGGVCRRCSSSPRRCRSSSRFGSARRARVWQPPVAPGRRRVAVYQRQHESTDGGGLRTPARRPSVIIDQRLAQSMQGAQFGVFTISRRWCCLPSGDAARPAGLERFGHGAGRQHRPRLPPDHRVSRRISPAKHVFTQRRSRP